MRWRPGSPGLREHRERVPRAAHPGVVTPGGPGGPWLCSTLVLSLFQAVVVPSGFRTRVQPHRWITIWWWNQHSSTQSLTRGRAAVGLVLGVVDLARLGGLVAPPGPLAVPVPQGDRVADPGRDRLGVPDVQRQARAAQADAELAAAQEAGQPARAGQQVHGLADDRLLDGGPGRGGVRRVRPGLPSRRSRSSSTQSRTRSSRAPGSTSPVTIGAIAASQAIASAASPSSQAPVSPPPSDAAARCPAHRARTCAVHSSCSAELPSSRSRSASEMCAQIFTGCPARSGSMPGRDQAAHASAVFLRHA